MSDETTSTSRTSSDGQSTDDMVYVVDADELPPGERVIADVGGREIAIFNVKGSFHAVANYCVHQGGPVCEGMVSGTLSAKKEDDDWELTYDHEDEILSCPWHGWEFDIPTGEHLARTKYRLPTYDIVEEGGRLYLDV
jgi:nitrite reductase/ring-hydroxylating ferredoxin subunit